MFASDADVAAWVETHRREVRDRAARIFRRYIEHQRCVKATGGTEWVECWQWPEAIAEVLDLPQSSPLVRAASADLGERYNRWHLEDYDDPETFERLLDRFERAVDEALPPT
jgi:hypothetical protein